jgi:predicted GTPase
LTFRNTIDRLASALQLPHDLQGGLGRSLETVFLSPRYPLSDPSLLPPVKPIVLPKPSQPNFELTGMFTSAIQRLAEFAPGPNAAKFVHEFDLEKLKDEERVAVVREFFRAVTKVLTGRIEREVKRLKAEKGLIVKGLVASGGAAR